MCTEERDEEERMWRRSVFVFKEYFRGPTKKVIMPKMTNKPLNVCDRCILIRAPEIVQFPFTV